MPDQPVAPPLPGEAPGFFGKWPAQGDFVSRRLTNEFIDVWDAWLQDGLHGSRAQLGGNWLDTYLTSPIWNFAICGGICGSFPWSGALMPSVDRVGRYFPLTLAARLRLDDNPLWQLPAERWFSDSHRILLLTLDDAPYPVEALDRDITALGPPPSVPSDFVPGSAGFGEAWQLPLFTSAAGSLASVTHQLLLQRCGPYSIWWGAGSRQVAPSLLICRALPTPRQFVGLLNGEWAAADWSCWAATHPAGD